jgi:hypothetical protein
MAFSLSLASVKHGNATKPLALTDALCRTRRQTSVNPMLPACCGVLAPAVSAALRRDASRTWLEINSELQ